MYSVRPADRDLGQPPAARGDSGDAGLRGNVAREQTLLSVEDHIAPVAEIFRLQAPRNSRLRRSATAAPSNDRAIVLAARGAARWELTADRPKTMVEVRVNRCSPTSSRPTTRPAREPDGRAVTCPRGRPARLHYAIMPNTTTPASQVLARGLEHPGETGGDLYVSYGDVIFRRYIIDPLAEPPMT